MRVDIDENDAWRFRPGAPALAYVRGNPDLKTPLRFERFEPYVIPKQSLTGDTTERVDTRVLQVIYSLRASTVRATVMVVVRDRYRNPPLPRPSPYERVEPEVG